MIRQHGGVQSIVKEAHPNAHYIYCYIHQFSLILQQPVSQITSFRIFFANLNAFSVFSLALQREYHALMIVWPGEFLDLLEQDGISIVEFF